MKRLVLFLLGSALCGSLAACSSCASKEPTVSVKAAAALEPAAPLSQSVLLWPFSIRELKDHKSQSPYLCGGDLEYIGYIEELESPSGAPPQWRAALLDVNFRFTGEFMPVKVEVAGEDQGHLLYVVRSKGQNLCEEDVYQATTDEIHQRQGGNSPIPEDRLKGKALRVPGYWRNGTWAPGIEGRRVHTFSCLSGAVAKCAYWGYTPDEKDPRGGELGPYHRACVHAVRAEYMKGSRMAFTCAGTDVDIYDNRNVLKKEMKEARFESLWNEDGLVCMARSRWGSCESELTTANVRRETACEDPGAGMTGWSRTASSGGSLIAVSGPPDLNLGICPNDQGTRYLCPHVQAQ